MGDCEAECRSLMLRQNTGYRLEGFEGDAVGDSMR